MGQKITLLNADRAVFHLLWSRIYSGKSRSYVVYRTLNVEKREGSPFPKSDCQGSKSHDAPRQTEMSDRRRIWSSAHLD
jgi:hypothetical protein